MRLPRPLLPLILTLLAAFAVQAQTPASPYAVTEPVSDTSETVRDQAFADALAQVLARVAGGQDLSSSPGYDDALKGAPGLVQNYQYHRAGTGIELQLSFDPGAVRRLVKQLGVPARAPRPPVLVLVRDALGKPLDRQALAPLAQSAAQHGYQLQYPDPSAALDPAALAAASPDALARVDRQYHTGLILLGNLHPGSADWTLVSGGRAQQWSVAGNQPDQLLAKAGDELTGRLASQFNVIGSGVSEGRLWIGGVGSALAFADLLSAVRADPSVRQVQTVAAHDGGFLLAVKASVPIDALAVGLAAGGRMIQDTPHPGADASLRWLR